MQLAPEKKGRQHRRGKGLGRSRGGLSAKVHLAVDGRGLPMCVVLAPGQAGDSPQLVPLLDEISVAMPGPGGRGGRSPTFDPQLYKRRKPVERCFNRLNQFRGLATRYAKRAAYYQAELTIGTIILWLG
jgi:transposase